MDKILEKLRQQLQDLHASCQTILNTAEAEERDLTAEEQVTLDQQLSAFDDVQAEVDRRERLNKQSAILSAGTGRRTAPEASADTTPHAAPRVIGNSNVARSGTHGFRDMGAFAQAVQRACRPGGRVDERIQNAPTAVGTEGTDADGGFAVPPDFREQIALMVNGEDTLISRTDQYTTSSNSVEVPKDEGTPWGDGSGITVAWTSEASIITESKPALSNKVVALEKLAGLVPVSEELLTDAPLLDTYLMRKAPQKIGHKLNFAVVQGTGSGQPEGILNSGAKVAVAKEAAQVADTIVFENVMNMYSRQYYKDGAVWLANSDTLPQLIQMQFPGDSSPVYLPNNSVAGAPHGTLFGRPIIFTEACNTVGDEGDLIFVNLGQYMSVQKSSGTRADVSMHLYFNYDVQAFRFITRFGGETWLDAPISARDAGSPTLSSVVTLAVRA